MPLLDELTLDRADSVQKPVSVINDQVKALIGPEAAAVLAPEPASDVLSSLPDTIHLSDAWIAQHLNV